MKQHEIARNAYNEILGRSSNSHRDLADIIKVADLASSKQMILEVMTNISAISKKTENPALRFLRKFGLSRVIDKTTDAATQTITEGKSVSQVSDDMLRMVTTKRESVINMVDKLYDLRETMVSSYKEMEIVIQGIDEVINGEVHERDHFHLTNLKSEILESMSYNEDNIISANGTIKAAEMATNQINEMIPKLRSQVNDSMVIRGSLNELDMLTSMCESIDDMCSALRTENRDSMETTLVQILDKSVVSEKRLAAISNNVKRQSEIQANIANKVSEITTQRSKAVLQLQNAVNKNKVNLGLSYDDNSGLAHTDRDE